MCSPFGSLARLLALALLGLMVGMCPGLAQGALINGGNHSGTLALNAEHSWTFQAEQGQFLFLRLATSDLYPEFTVYGPDGGAIGTASDSSISRDAEFSATAALSGAYVVAVKSHFAGEQGSYSLRFARLPGDPSVETGDEGGAMTSGGIHAGELPRGDLDVWHFDVPAGTRVFLRAATTGAYPSMTVVGPEGFNLTLSETSIARDIPASFLTAVAGRHFVLLQG